MDKIAEKISKWFLSIILINILISCVITETVVNDINSVTENKNLYNGDLISKSAETYESYISISIFNEAENTTLKIDSLELCNVLYKDEITGIDKKGNLILMRTNDECCWVDYGIRVRSAEMPILEQTIVSWKTNESIYNTKGTYVKVYGGMYSYMGDGNKYPLYEGVMYLMFSGFFKRDRVGTVDAKIYDGCPLYYIDENGNVEKVLQSIKFDVSVNGWNEIDVNIGE